MGSGSFDPARYAAYTKTTTGKTVDEVFARREIHPNLNPFGVKIRESRDSSDNPFSTPIIIALDVTGSMGMLADTIARQGLGVLFNELFEHEAVKNPHVMFMGVGDANVDSAPLQVSQFEADNRVVEQLAQLWIEHGGGGNSFESYNLPWYFAARHTVHDSYEKRAKRGYLFTVGDEEAPETLTRDQISRFIGDTLESDMSPREMLNEAMRTYDVFHVMVGEGDHARHAAARVKQSWAEALGQRAIWMDDHKKLAEIIIGAIEVAEGRDAETVAKRLGLKHDAMKAIKPGRTPLLPA